MSGISLGLFNPLLGYFEMGFNNFFTTEITEPTETRPESLNGKILGAAIEVHRALGPGLLESTYEACLIYELRN